METNQLMRHASLLLAAALTAAALAPGCQPKYTRPVVEPAPMTAEQKQFDRYWQASLQVLSRYRFRIDRKNPRAGVITTWPMVGKQLAELWRHDTARTTDAVESTVQTIYRSVKVTIRKTDGPAGFEPVVEVFVSRSNKPTLGISTTSDAYNLFSKPARDRTITGDQEAAQWVDLGNDKALEAKIRRAILAEAGRG